MYRRPKFLEVLLEIRREMALEADYDVDLFAEIARSGNRSSKGRRAGKRMGLGSVYEERNAPKLDTSRKE